MNKTELIVSLRVTNDDGKALLRNFEGLRLKAYRCPAGVWTIGYGHTGPNVKEGMVITKAQAEELLVKDLIKFENAVNKLVKPELTDNQFSALVCFVYNVGASAFRKSTMLKRLNEKSFKMAGAEFEKWTRAGGVKLPGLVRRRAAELELFNKP